MFSELFRVLQQLKPLHEAGSLARLASLSFHELENSCGWDRKLLPRSLVLDKLFETTSPADCLQEVDQVLSVLLEERLQSSDDKMEPRPGSSTCQDERSLDF